METLFLQSLRVLNDYYGLEYQFYYWRTVSGVGVDFIAYGSNGFHAFEIKRAHTVSGHDSKGLRAFQQEYPKAQLYLIYNGNKRYYFDTIKIIPMVDALHDLPEILTAVSEKEN